MSKLLTNDNPLLVPPSLAKAVGLNEAIFLQQLEYWIKHEKGGCIDPDGNKWVRNTATQWAENFPFWSEKTVKRIIASLEKQELLISTSELNKLNLDRTKWYRIDYEKLYKIDGIEKPGTSRKGQSDPMEESKEVEAVERDDISTSEPLAQSDPIASRRGQLVPSEGDNLSPSIGSDCPVHRDNLSRAIPETTTETTTETTEERGNPREIETPSPPEVEPVALSPLGKQDLNNIHYLLETKVIRAANGQNLTDADILEIYNTLPETEDRHHCFEVAIDAVTERTLTAVAEIIAGIVAAGSLEAYELANPPPNHKHPAIMLYRAIANRWPDQSLLASIAKTVGTEPANLVLFEKAIRGAIGAGWRKDNLNAILDRFKSGDIPGEDNGHQNGQGRTRTQKSGTTGQTQATSAKQWADSNPNLDDFIASLAK